MLSHLCSHLAVSVTTNMYPAVVTALVALLVVLAHIDAAPLPAIEHVGASRLRLSASSRTAQVEGEKSIRPVVRAADGGVDGVHSVTSRFFLEDLTIADPEFCDEFLADTDVYEEEPEPVTRSDTEQPPKTAASKKSAEKSPASSEHAPHESLPKFWSADSCQLLNFSRCV